MFSIILQLVLLLSVSFVASSIICKQNGCTNCVYVSSKFTEKNCTRIGVDWNCSSLVAVFEEIPSLDNFCVFLNDTQTLETQLNITNAHNLSIFGLSHTIRCTEKHNTGLLITYSGNISFHQITFSHCGGEVNSLAYDTENHQSIPAKISTAFYFDDVKDINFDTVQIISSKGYGLFMLDCTGNIIFSKVTININRLVNLSNGNLYNFTSGGGIVFQHLSVTKTLTSKISLIESCQIMSSISQTSYEWIRPFGYGGGISLLFLGKTSGNTVNIFGATINNNAAVSGGGVYIEHGLQSVNNTVNFHYNFIGNNSANIYGGGISYYTENYPAILNNKLTINWNRIITNRAGNGKSTGLGGAFCQRKKRDNKPLQATSSNHTLITTQAEFRLNDAGLGSALYFDNADVTFHGPPDRSVIISNNGYDGGYAAVYSYKSKLSIYGEVDLQNNLNTGIVLDNSVLSLEIDGMMFLWDNQGINGGAAALYEESEIRVAKNGFLNFKSNSANKGAAIYLDVVEIPYRISNINSRLLPFSCFIKFDEGAGMTNFSKNVAADDRGNSIFATTLKKQCLGDFPTWPKFNFADDGKNAVKTNPVYLNATVIQSTHVYPGQTILINVSLRDEYHNAIHTTLRLSTDDPHISPDFVYKQVTSRDLIILTLSGPKLVQARPFKLTLTPLEGSADAISLNFTMTGCIFGYNYWKKDKRCKCARNDSYIIECNTTNNEIYLKKNTWVYKNRANHCPNNYCKCYNHDLTDACVYNESNQCTGNRNENSILCSRCKHGQSVNLGGESCVDCGNSLHLIWIIPVTIITIVMIELIFLKCDIDVYKFYLNSFFYFYQITAMFDYTPLYPINKVIVGLVNLEGLNIHNKGFCIFEHFTDLDKNMFNYIFPVLALLILWVLVKLVRFNQENCYHAIVFIIFWSYADVMRITTNILRPVELAGSPNTLRVYFDGESKYFHGKHIFYGIVACLFALLVVLFPLGLLLSRLLVSFRCFARLLPIFNCFNFCFKDDIWSQTFASNYFILRIIFHVIYSMSSIKPLQVLQTTVTCFSVFVLFVFVISKPYKDGGIDAPDNYNYLNYYDTVILSLLSAVIFLFNGRRKFLNDDVTRKRIDVAINVLILLPFCWVLLKILVFTPFNKCKDRYEILVEENKLEGGFYANIKWFFARKFNKIDDESEHLIAPADGMSTCDDNIIDT